MSVAFQFLKRKDHEESGICSGKEMYNCISDRFNPTKSLAEIKKRFLISFQKLKTVFLNSFHHNTHLNFVEKNTDAIINFSLTYCKKGENAVPLTFFENHQFLATFIQKFLINPGLNIN